MLRRAIRARRNECGLCLDPVQNSWSFSNLVALIRQQLFVYRDLYPWLNDPFQAPPVLAGVHDGQLAFGF
jgi:hypothetical protein